VTRGAPPGVDAIAPREETVGYLVWDARRAYSRDFAEQLRAHGLGIAAFSILRILWEEDGLTQAQIAQRARMSGPTIVAVVAQLEKQGLARRLADPADQRKRLIHLRPRARRLADSILPLARAINDRALAGFTPEESRLFMAFLRRMRGNFLDPDDVRGD
jgi:DNA-binding MarR family transcriptional regulator